ncbi:hypothetical protein BH11ACT3_BH11ACT3_10290 [soil metagenome]
MLAAVAAFAIIAVTAIMPAAPPNKADALEAYIDAHAQSLTVSQTVTTSDTTRDAYSATAGIATLKAGGTNYDWAKLVMLFGGWPASEGNITVFTRWMRQENGADDWWNRNNPLNNGWGTQGGTFMSGYVNLVDAAENAAEAINTNPGYAGIKAAFAADGDPAATESAIWNSSWATGHYAYGGHWHYTPVDQVVAPAGAWG